MTTFAVSALAVNSSDRTLRIRHTVFTVAASNRDEAEGKANRIARKIYPTREGWERHDVSIKDAACDPVEPETSTLMGRK